jgi:hypothetical protein
MNRPADYVANEAGTTLRPRDRAVVDAIDRLESMHIIEAHWWNNASFLLPLLVGVVSLGIGAVTRSFEALGFAAFLFAVTAFMFPVVMVTWRRTPTAIVLTTDRILALHEGRILRELRWSEVARIERADYDNIKWRIRPHEGDHLSIESELTDVDGLIDAAHRLSGLPRKDVE